MDLVAESRAPGLRVQIVLALAGLMLFAFVPLFFAVASVTRATLLDAREKGRARSVAPSRRTWRGTRAGGRTELERVLGSHVGHGALRRRASGARDRRARSLRRIGRRRRRHPRARSPRTAKATSARTAPSGARST